MKNKKSINTVRYIILEQLKPKITVQSRAYYPSKILTMGLIELGDFTK
jgi:hypothetical protein